MIELIAKDKKGNLQFEGRCKLTIDCVSKLLLIEPFIEEFKMISALFKWKFVAANNILFVFAEFDFQDFALIFDNEHRCYKAMGYLINKGATSGDKNMIKERFLPALFNEILKNDQSSTKMKEILLKWIEQKNGKEKEEYIQILKEFNVFDLIYPLRPNPRKRKAKDARFNQRPEVMTPVFQNVGDNCQNRVARLNKIIEAPLFQVNEYIQNGILRNKLSIFTSDDKRYCYEYCWCKKGEYYRCNGCTGKKKYMTAKIIKRNGKDVVQLNDTKHICTIRKCKILFEKPNFEVVKYDHLKEIRNRLVIFLDSSRKECYEFSWCSSVKKFNCCGCNILGCTIPAEICQRKDGTEFVMVKSKQHICKIRPYDPTKYHDHKILESSNFKIFKNIQNGIDKSKLVIFISNDQCYEYLWDRKKKRFYCCDCKNKNEKFISSELHQNADGSDYLKLSKMEHLCEPILFDPKKYEISSKIVKYPNFKIFHFQHKGTSASRIVIFCETNMNLCYEYYKYKKHHEYCCTYCPLENRVTATVCHDKEEPYLILSNAEHECELREYDPEKYKDDAILEKSMYNITSTTLRQGLKHQMITVFTSEEKKFYYRFIYYTRKKCYFCSGCHSLKVHLAAIFENEGKENERVFVSSQRHACEPLEYQSFAKDNIVEAPNFQFFTKRNNQRMVVFIDDEKTKCYEYSWNKNCKYYVCFTSAKLGTHIYAKVIQNEEKKECIQLCLKAHKCQPTKFIPENQIIVQMPNFKLWEETVKNKKMKRLTIFDSNDANYGYIYTYETKDKVYHCYSCKSKIKKNKHLTAKLLQNENGQNYLELNDDKHVCDLHKL